MKGLTRKNIKTVIICSWILAYIPLLPSLFEIYGIHGLECQTRQCKILPIGSKGVSVKRYFEIVLHVFWAIVLVAANIGILIQYWVSALIKDNFFILSTEKVVLACCGKLLEAIGARDIFVQCETYSMCVVCRYA